jgi:uncharacterized protein (DUF488 family)
MDAETATLTIYTVGHSNQTTEEFLALLHRHGIDVLVDVRSAPYSSYVPHFNQPALAELLRETRVRYLYLGKELGGRPPLRSMYDDDGRAFYNLVAETPEFREGVERLMAGAERFRVAIMCSEENPKECHRSLLVGRVLLDEGVRVVHIRGNGDTEEQQPHADDDTPRQQSLFPEDDRPARTSEWKSVRSVLPRNLRDNSSAS